MEMLLLVTETSFGLLLGRLLVSTEMYCKKWIHLPIQETKEIEHTALNYVPSKNNEIKCTTFLANVTIVLALGLYILFMVLYVCGQL